MKSGARPVAVLALLLALLCGVLLSVWLKDSGSRPSEADASAPAAGMETDTEGFTLSCPNLGKADAFLLQSDEGAVLIDTGEQPEDVLSLLRARKVTRLEALVLSHFDKDHIGGAAAVLRQVEVKTLYRTDREEDSEPYAALMAALAECDTEVVTVTDTLSVTAAGARLTLYPPLSASYGKDEDNNSSLIAAVDADGAALLFTGDALKSRVQEFLELQYDGTAYQLLKVPHHGDEVKPTALLLERFTPQWAIITSSYEEPESEKLLRRLEQEDVEVLLTRQGALTLRCVKGKVEKIP